MTTFEIRRLNFTNSDIEVAAERVEQLANWPVVYTINNRHQMYVGETGHAERRLRQHRLSESKQHLENVQLILDDTFNKSACLDLESFLIRLFAGDGQYQILNRNDGVTNARYYDRDVYRQTFRQIFEELRSGGYFARSIPEIENQDLYKLSPYKSLNDSQRTAVVELVEALEHDLREGAPSLRIVSGGPGTGKTIVAIFLLKLLRDVAAFDATEGEEVDGDSVYADFFLEGTRELFRGLRIGMVVPQQSLRTSIERVFARIPALVEVPVLSAFQVGEDPEEFDLLLVDEAHRLTQFAAQAHGTLTKKYKEITRELFGWENPEITQLDWLQKKSRHCILMLDQEQAVRPRDIPADAVARLTRQAQREGRLFTLLEQMRVQSAGDFLDFVAQLLSDGPAPPLPELGDYELLLFHRLGDMRDKIREQDARHGLARLVAGYAWPWISKDHKDSYDIVADGVQLRWNSTDVDWINSRTALEEAGSIHTVQGYDLNYAGVIIGGDLGFDAESNTFTAHKDRYFDKAGKQNIKMRNQVTTDDDLLQYIRNIYRVLLTRGIRGTYVYAVDPGVRARLAEVLPSYEG